MQFFKNRSMFAKLTFSVVPTLIVAVIVSIYIYRTSVKANPDVDKAIKLVAIVNKEELEMVKMSEALRGYLLDPKNKVEAERKLAADETFGKLSEELVAMTADNKEIQDLAREMADYDAHELNEIENLVMNEVATSSPNAANIYVTKYVPAREKQNTRFNKMRELVIVYSQDLLANVDSARKKEALGTIALLWIGLIFGTGTIFIVSYRISRQINSIFERIYSVSDSLASSSDLLSQNSANLSDGSQREAAAIQETAAAIDQVSSMISRNSENARNSRLSSANSKAAAEAGQSTIGDMIQATTDIEVSYSAIMNQVEEGNRKVSEIVKVIAEISDKTKVINDIVFQTKILSFNASVEAARAGEDGKGFSVVAEEVGKLAQLSGNAAKEINDMLASSVEKVESIVVATKVGVERLIADGKQKIVTGSETATRCGDVLSKLASTVGDVDGMVAEIAAASSEQAQGMGEIGKAMNQLDSATQSNAKIAAEAADTSESLRTQSVDLRELVNSMVKLVMGEQTIKRAS